MLALMISFSLLVSSLEINVVDAIADVSEWEELACQIDLDLGKLHELQQSGKSPDQCKKELLRYWIDKDKRASWTKLSQALERMKKVEIAQMIKEKYFQPCSQGMSNSYPIIQYGTLLLHAHAIAYFAWMHNYYVLCNMYRIDFKQE